MGCRPYIDPVVVAQLKQIRREYFVEWNRLLNNWEVWGRTHLGKKYMILRVRNNDGSYRPVDSRTISYIRWLQWLNQSPEVYVREMRKMLSDEEKHQESLERKEYNYMLGIGEALYRPYQMLAREMGWSSGKAKIPTVQGADFK